MARKKNYNLKKRIRMVKELTKTCSNVHNALADIMTDMADERIYLNTDNLVELARKYVVLKKFKTEQCRLVEVIERKE